MLAVYRHRSIFAVLLLVPAALAACGTDRPPRTITSSAGARTPAVAAARVTTTPGTTAAVTPATPVSYDDAEAVFRSGAYGDAADLFASYTERKPDNVWGYYMLGMSAWRAGDLHRAEQAFGHALEVDPHHQKSLLNSSRVLLELGRAAEALDRIQLAVEQDTRSAEGLRLLGRAWDQLGDTDKAIEAYRAALVRQPDDVWSMNNLGLIYIDRDQPELALPPLARAVQLRGNAPVFQNNLGIALERTGHPLAAATAFEAALQADSSYGKAAASLARVQAAAAEQSDPVDLSALAETFRLHERIWQESADQPMDAEVEAAPEPADTMTDLPAMVVSDSTATPVDSVRDSLP